MTTPQQMTTKHITTSHEQELCEICGRTLLRGEHAEVFVDGSRRHSVCVLCKGYALQEGWVRANSLAETPVAEPAEPRRRSLFGRRARRAGLRDDGDSGDGREIARSLDDELALGTAPVSRRPRGRDGASARSSRLDAYDSSELDVEPYDGGIMPTDLTPRELAQHDFDDRAPQFEELDRVDEEESRSARRRRRGARADAQIHAVPIDAEQKINAAIDAFNRSEHTRTVAGVARSLGAPNVTVMPDGRIGTVVWIVIAWELHWYRYEVDLGSDPGYVRIDSEGDELAELGDAVAVANAGASRDGRLGR